MPPTRKPIASLRTHLARRVKTGKMLGQCRCHPCLGPLGVDQWGLCQPNPPARQRLGHLILLPGNPAIPHATRQAFHQSSGLPVQGQKGQVVDAPVAGHLVDHELAITLYLERTCQPGC
jgi:hypothetical protein